MCRRGDVEIAPDCDIELFQIIDLLEECARIDDDTIPDDACLPLMENGRRQQMQYVFLVADPDGMPGIMAALIADNDVEGRREQVDDFTLPFVPPLRTDDTQVEFVLIRLGNNRCNHCQAPICRDFQLEIADIDQDGVNKSNSPAAH